MRDETNSSDPKKRRGRSESVVCMVAAALLAGIASSVLSCGDADLVISGTPPIRTPILTPDGTPEATETPEQS